MHVQRWCACCEQNQHECKCTPAMLERHSKSLQLDAARSEVHRLELELGIKPTGVHTGNRHQKRAALALARKVR